MKKSDSILIDKIKAGFKFKTSAEVARFLGATPTMIYQVESGEKPLSFSLRIKILDKLGALSVRNLLIDIAPERIGEKILQLSLNAARNCAQENKEIRIDDSNLPILVGQNVAADLLNRFQDFFGYDTKELSEVLGIDQTTIYAIKAGKQKKLSNEVRTRMLHEIDQNFKLEIIEEAISSTDFLVGLLDEYFKTHSPKKPKSPG
jgi:transcriptional regulator with XRE-family HTH domain